MYADGGGVKLEQKVVLSNAERKSVEQLTQDLEEQRELASTRMVELEKHSDLIKMDSPGGLTMWVNDGGSIKYGNHWYGTPWQGDF